VRFSRLFPSCWATTIPSQAEKTGFSTAAPLPGNSSKTVLSSLLRFRHYVFRITFSALRFTHITFTTLRIYEYELRFTITLYPLRFPPPLPHLHRAPKTASPSPTFSPPPRSQSCLAAISFRRCPHHHVDCAWLHDQLHFLVIESNWFTGRWKVTRRVSPRLEWYRTKPFNVFDRTRTPAVFIRIYNCTTSSPATLPGIP